ncbi:phosphoribosylaminoimidazolesuccinocarboxamide synthase [Myxococcota bacterium]|nr:phosphoribosylaminoimidazolesuccinocarboxamide synthase [Myxococcota bacterium]MBU1535365.1 phosphoribosylaminoimidazolesuccinocarboxamide synthase [Myxococcota bacterium]
MEHLIEKQLEKDTVYTDLGPLWPLTSRGKVRDIFAVGDDKLLFVVSDRVSVFDRVVGTVPFKGQILNSIAAWWMEQVEHILPHHMISLPHGCATLAKRLTPLPVEIIVRGYLTGNSSTSIYTAYSRDERSYCGHLLPEGLQKDRPLPEPLVTPTTKGEVGAHDELISREEIISRGLVPRKVYDEVCSAALKLFALGSQRAARQGLILADTKYEFGLDSLGTLHLIDEIHTPDSSRYWFADDYEALVSAGKSPRGLDKDYVRNYMKSVDYHGDGQPPPLPDSVRVEASRRYMALYELLMGSPFSPDERDVKETLLTELSTYQ